MSAINSVVSDVMSDLILSVESHTNITRKFIKEGSYGIVSKIKDSSNSVWAEKRANLFDDGKLSSSNIREANVLSLCKTFNGVINAHCLFVNSQKNKIITYMPIGDSTSMWVKNVGIECKIKHFEKMFIPCVNDLIYLHKNGIIHGDIKLGNTVCIDGTVRLIDFGGSSFETNKWLNHTCTVTNRSPELFIDPIVVGSHNDVWSLAMVFVEYFTGNNPVFEKFKDDERGFSSLNDIKIYKYITSTDFTQYLELVPNKYKQLITKMLSVDYKQRCTMADVLNVMCENTISIRDPMFVPEQFKYSNDELAVIKKMGEILDSFKTKIYRHCFQLGVITCKRYCITSGAEFNLNNLYHCLYISAVLLTDCVEKIVDKNASEIGEIDNTKLTEIITALEFKLYSLTFYKWFNDLTGIKVTRNILFTLYYKTPENFNLSYEQIREKYFNDGTDRLNEFRE